MKVVAMLLALIAAIALILSSMAYGDIAISIALASIVAILTSVGFFLASRKKR